MQYSYKLRKIFPEISLYAEDLLLLDTFQIKYLPDRVTIKEFTSLIRAYPVVQRFLVSQYPPIGSFLTCILEENRLIRDKNMIEEISTITSLEGKVVADVGTGSGRIAFLVVPFVQTVFAVEPIASFRSFMKENAVKQETGNLYVMDETFPDLQPY